MQLMQGALCGTVVLAVIMAAVSAGEGEFEYRKPLSVADTPPNVAFHISTHAHQCICYSITSSTKGYETLSSSVYMGLKRKKLRPYDRGYSEHFHREFFRRIQNCIGRTGTSFDVLESMAQAGVLTPQTPPTIAEANDFASSYLADPDYFIEDDLLDQMSRGTLHQLVSSLRGCVCADQTYAMRPDWQGKALASAITPQIHFQQYAAQRMCIDAHKARVARIKENLIKSRPGRKKRPQPGSPADDMIQVQPQPWALDRPRLAAFSKVISPARLEGVKEEVQTEGERLARNAVQTGQEFLQSVPESIARVVPGWAPRARVQPKPVPLGI